MPEDYAAPSRCFTRGVSVSFGFCACYALSAPFMFLRPHLNRARRRPQNNPLTKAAKYRDKVIIASGDRSLPFTVLPLSFHCISLSFHCPFTVFPLSFHCPPAVLHCPSAVLFLSFPCPSTDLSRARRQAGSA